MSPSEPAPSAIPSNEEIGVTPSCVQSVAELIGHTPMLELRRFAADEERASLFAKLELWNPGGSVKDRLGVGLIDWAEERGLVQPGATLIEPTAGNTGIGLALVGAQRGYDVILVVPERFSIEKVLLMDLLGGRVVRTPNEEGMQGAIRKAKELAAEMPNAYVPCQFENPGNAEIHYRTTAVEMWEQLDGRVDAVVIGVGSGGTFSGVARFVAEHAPDALRIAVEPQGSILGGGDPGPHEVEGIGVSFFPEVLARDLIHEVVTVDDRDAFETMRRIARTEGLMVGGSSGANCFAALEVARRLGPGRRVVTVFPDSAERYLSKRQGVSKELR